MQRGNLFFFFDVFFLLSNRCWDAWWAGVVCCAGGIWVGNRMQLAGCFLFGDRIVCVVYGFAVLVLDCGVGEFFRGFGDVLFAVGMGGCEVSW